MALQQREICRVGESPSTRRRSASPRRGSGGKDDHSPGHDDQPSLTASSSEARSSPKNERRISTRLLMQKGGNVESPTKNGKSPKHAAWKTSKFFSRSMASGELLKGFKKLSSGASGSSTPQTSASSTEEDGTPLTSVDTKEHSDSSASRSFVSRFSSLRRKSGSDTDTVPKVDSETLQHGSSDVRGIVCKKEDLMFLMTKVPGQKDRRVSSPAELIVPVASSLPTSPIPVLKSPSIKVAPNSPLTRGSFRSSRSASLDPTALPNVERAALRAQSSVNKPPPAIRTMVYQPPPPTITHGMPAQKQQQVKGSVHRKKTTDDICIKKTGTFLEVVPEVKRRLSGPLIQVKDRILEENEDGEDGDNPVAWDDNNFVDPNLLGGAIEAFLKGMNTSPSPTPTTEKRVSFKKNLIK
ncbi:hypothetical protein JTE90_014297 [Oedothorax gibbosus]|uniref:Uncharacterized protein n=1 Tax=Oedothorax gibbosus TaxID=931172 RepID=A0AAV6UHQ9_9ARAC|nr:hypothetical protein JTE90_014297 [Oedothorax gibbosus]